MINADTAKSLTIKSMEKIIRKFSKDKSYILNEIEKEIKKSISEGVFCCKLVFEISEDDFNCLEVILEDGGYTVSRDCGYIASVAFDISWDSK